MGLLNACSFGFSLLRPTGKKKCVCPLLDLQIRDHLNMSQEVFARCLHTSRRTLEKWEQGQAKPTGTAAALLTLVEQHPSVIEELAAM
jgi:putative transcriptional regulator